MAPWKLGYGLVAAGLLLPTVARLQHPAVETVDALAFYGTGVLLWGTLLSGAIFAWRRLRGPRA